MFWYGLDRHFVSGMPALLFPRRLFAWESNEMVATVNGMDTPKLYKAHMVLCIQSARPSWINFTRLRKNLMIIDTTVSNLSSHLIKCRGQTT